MDVYAWLAELGDEAIPSVFVQSNGYKMCMSPFEYLSLVLVTISPVAGEFERMVLP